MNILQSIIDSGVKLTPMMKQFHEIKINHQEAILLFRMGDFYEAFFEDASLIAKTLNIAQTHRGKLGDTPIPMAGIPYHAASNYVDKLTSAGFKVAICEQIEDPKEAVGIVKRAVTQVVSPGIPYDIDKSTSSDQHFIISTFCQNNKFYLVAIDFTTGDFHGHVIKSSEELKDKIKKYSPKEFITFRDQWENTPDLISEVKSLGTSITFLNDDYFNAEYTKIYTEKFIPSFESDQVIKSELNILCPIGAISYYITTTQSLDSYDHIRPFKLHNEEGHLKISSRALLGLEILPKSREYYKESLLGFFDRTKTAIGSRALQSFFHQPLTDLKSIKERQKVIKSFLSDITLTQEVRNQLTPIRDIERILTKVVTNKANSTDYLQISQAIITHDNLVRNTINFSEEIIQQLNNQEQETTTQLSNLIIKSINDELGASLEKGNLIKTGTYKKRDKLARLHTDMYAELEKIESKYKKVTGITKLKVKFNNVAGFFIEVSKGESKKVPDNFTRRQTLVNSERYTTKELDSFEKEVLSSKEKLERLEKEIYQNIRQEVISSISIIQSIAKNIAYIDAFQSLSWVAHQEELSCPNLVKNKKTLRIEQAWHPLIKKVILDQFVCHDLELSKDRFFGLITGPNMAGKTTVMREMVIIQYLAQIGSFVPAKSASLSITDFIFSRLGASDDIQKGQSTFMVEMSETAEILRHATSSSLIILDEVGRGTSTYDGLSIAWALVEHIIQKIKARTLFATHYHELVDLAERESEAKNLTVETISKDGDVQFLYRLIEQPAGQSYGIYVAKLAGLPNSLLKRSQEILNNLESTNPQKSVTETLIDDNQLSFFNLEEKEEAVPTHLKELQNQITQMDLIQMTPFDCMMQLKNIKDNLESSTI
jgi:DNA mismatch repair protein MutS